jgi:hypothetical protein
MEFQSNIVKCFQVSCYILCDNNKWYYLNFLNFPELTKQTMSNYLCIAIITDKSRETTPPSYLYSVVMDELEHSELEAPINVSSD